MEEVKNEIKIQELKMQELKICHCGFPQDNHYFVHEFLENTNVVIDSIQRFSLDATTYPLKKAERCSYPNCKIEAKLHSPIDFDPNWTQEKKDELRDKYKCILEHMYKPEEYLYREIRFVVPENSTCCYKNCRVLLKDHKSIMTHHFHTLVHIDNLKEIDKVFVEDGDDEDRKIVWKN
jgi:hypothetical protein